MNGGERIDAVELEVEGFAPVDLYQRREKIITRFVGGFYQRLRFFTGWPLLLGYFLLPWLNWDGRQAVLFDLPARQFHILGTTFWPEDLWLLGWLLIIAAFGLFTVTTIVGRLWCGYTCPQTVWTAIFMWIEQLCEGSRNQRIRLDQAPMSARKAARRGAKHALWLGVALLTGLTFVGYFTPIRPLAVSLVLGGASGWALFWVAFFTLATYFNAGWLREQVCTYMCPYARFQGAMIDADSLVVTYDAARGEPRGKGRERHDIGDCVDCSLCVQVCPTGIDIRDGLQYECIGCAHCIDACNQVMQKLALPAGLIRYSTERALGGGATRWFRPRSVGYAIATSAMCALLLGAVVTRAPFSFELTRERGALHQADADGTIRNRFDLKVANKSATPMTLTARVVAPTGITLAAPPLRPLAARSSTHYDVSLRLANRRPQLEQRVQLELCAQQAGRQRPHCQQEQTTFFGPAS